MPFWNDVMPSCVLAADFRGQSLQLNHVLNNYILGMGDDTKRNPSPTAT
jgi:hypothetical protein